jgi:hypothetical protein
MSLPASSLAAARTAQLSSEYSMLRFALIALLLLTHTDARAQSSLVGFDGGALAIENTGAADLAASYLITGQHGLQLDFSVGQAEEAWRARVGGHLYLMPGKDRRYGLFIAFSDMNDAPIWAIEGGIEGVWSLGASTMGLRAGAGLARPGALDYLFAGASWRQQLTETYSVKAEASVQEFDEANLSAIGAQAEISVTYRPRNSPLALSTGYRIDTLTGYAPKATVFAAFAFAFGQRPSFGDADPLASLWSRSLVGN